MSPIVSDWKQFQLLVIVKAYPEISTKDGEISCTACINKEGNWYRIYPIPFRDLKPNQKFKKWQWITLTAAKHSDPRPESYQVQPDTITLGTHLDSTKHLNQRKQLLHKAVFNSLHDMEDLNKTMGAFKPKQVIDLIISPSTKEKSLKQKTVMNQGNLLTNPKSPLMEKPYSFKFKFICNDLRCKSHTLEIVDWEIHQTYFTFLKTYGNQKLALQKLKKKWLDYHHFERNTYFVAGTHHRFGTWMLNGYFSLGIHDKLSQFQEALF